MSNVLQFTPRPRPVEPPPSLPLTEPEVRIHLEEIGHAACDLVERVSALADFLDGEGSPLAAVPREPATKPEEMPEPIPVEVAADPEPEPIILPEPYVPVPLPWHGAGNVVSAAGCAILALVTRVA